MTSTATTKTSNSVTIYGNVGNDPETITFEARSSREGSVAFGL